MSHEKYKINTSCIVTTLQTGSGSVATSACSIALAPSIVIRIVYVRGTFNIIHNMYIDSLESEIA